jgi:hypothetical protein
MTENSVVMTLPGTKKKEVNRQFRIPDNEELHYL